MKLSRFVLCAGLVFGVELRSVDAVEFEKVLLPVAQMGGVNGGTPGAFGSLWKVEIVGRNDADVSVIIEPTSTPRTCVITVCPNFERGPHTTFAVPADITRSANPGVFKFVSKPANEHVSFNLRVFDTSGASLTWGTEIPAVHENEARTQTITLLNVPTDPRFRANLRIYDFNGNFSDDVLVRFFAAEDERPLSESVLNLQTPQGGDPQDSPGFGQIGNFVEAFPQLAAVDRLRVEVVPISPGLRFWAFISVTNNDTQQVTTITPH